METKTAAIDPKKNVGKHEKFRNSNMKTKLTIHSKEYNVNKDNNNNSRSQRHTPQQGYQNNFKENEDDEEDGSETENYYQVQTRQSRLGHAIVIGNTDYSDNNNYPDSRDRSTQRKTTQSNKNKNTDVRANNGNINGSSKYENNELLFQTHQQKTPTTKTLTIINENDNQYNKNKESNRLHQFDDVIMDGSKRNNLQNLKNTSKNMYKQNEFELSSVSQPHLTSTQSSSSYTFDSRYNTFRNSHKQFNARTIPENIQKWYLTQMAYAMDWCRKCNGKRLSYIASRAITKIPCFDWNMSDAYNNHRSTSMSSNKQHKSNNNGNGNHEQDYQQACNNVASCLALTLAEWEPLPQEFIELRNKHISDVDALSRRMDLYMNDLNSHRYSKDMAYITDEICAAMKNWLQKNMSLLQTQRNILRKIGQEHADSLTALLSINDWLCNKAETDLGEIASFYDTTVNEIAKEFEEPSSNMYMKSRAIQRNVDDLRADVRESGVLSDATMSALDAIAEASSSTNDKKAIMNMDQLSYMQRELTSERDRLTRRSYELKDESTDHEIANKKLQQDFRDMHNHLDTLQKRRKTLIEEKEVASDPESIIKLEMDLQALERQIGNHGTQMAQNLRLRQWTNEESTSRITKRKIIETWLTRLMDLQKILEDAVKEQSKTLGKQQEMQFMVDQEVQKTLQDLKSKYEKYTDDANARIMKQLNYRMDSLPHELPEESMVRLAHDNAKEYVLALSRKALQNPSLTAMKRDVEKLQSIVMELTNAQSQAARILNFEEMLESLKNMWSIVWAHDKKH